MQFANAIFDRMSQVAGGRSRHRYGVGGIQGVPVTGVLGMPVGSRPSGVIVVSVPISHDEWKPVGSPPAYGEGLVPNG